MLSPITTGEDIRTVRLLTAGPLLPFPLWQTSRDESKYGAPNRDYENAPVVEKRVRYCCNAYLDSCYDQTAPVNQVFV